MREDKVLWTSPFGSNGNAYRRLIIRNKRQPRLHLYGPLEKRKRAENIVADLAKESSTTGYAIDLDPETFAWACRGGFKVISAALGEGVVAFDVIPIPRRILVNGSNEDYRTTGLEGGLQASGHHRRGLCHMP